MQHPFIGDLSEKTIDELQETINKLTKNLMFMHRTQNSPMIGQLQMVIESYKAEYNKRIDEIYKKQNLGDKIKVSKDQQ